MFAIRSCFRKVVLVAACLGFASSTAALSLHLRDLGTLGGSTSSAFGVNDRGQVTGLSLIAGDGATHAFLFDGTEMVDLGEPRGYPPARHSAGLDINSHGEITGWFDDTAYLYDGTAMNAFGHISGWGAAINNQGQIAYNYRTGSLGFEAYLYDSENDRYTALGTLGGRSTIAEGINNLGQLTGSSDLGGLGGTRAFRYDAAGMVDLGILEPENPGVSVGLDINDLGHVTGVSTLDFGLNSTQHAILHDGERMIDLGTLSGGRASTGYGINNRGQVVGWSGAIGGQHAFLYDTNLGGMIDLNDCIEPGSGWTLNVAYDISENGRIVGYGTYEGQQRAFLLNPVPEPASPLLLAVGIAGLALRGRSNRQNKRQLI